MKRLRRTMLYVPGNNAGMIKDAGIYNADCIMFDLEDSVALDEKDAARFLVREALLRLPYGDKELFVRINSPDTKIGVDDLEAIVSTGKAAIRLPKTESAVEVQNCEEIITCIERDSDIPIGFTPMMAAVESAAGALSAREIAEASERMVALAIGAEDFVTDLGTTRSADGVELHFARSMVLLAAKAAGIAAIDSVFSDVNDEEGLIRETELIKQMGFDGKSIINPRQIGPIHRIFAPTEQEVESAKRVMDAIQEARARGSGVVSMDGKMVDKPVADRAEKLLELAKAAGAWK